MNRAIFFDRDGTIAVDVQYCRRPEDFKLFAETPKVIRALNKQGFKVIIVTNQSGISRGYFDESTLEKIHKKMKADLARKGAHIDGIYYCPHHPDDNCSCRKPKPALILQAAADCDIDLENSFVVGDLPKDIDLGKAAGCHTILINQSDTDSYKSSVPDVIVASISNIPNIVLKWPEIMKNRVKN
jgi:histidinol-phosphate phosphatase family protein